MATKRRRVWVVVDESGGLWGATQHGTEAREAAAKFEADGHDRRVVPFTERLPGDVVLSREEQYDVAQAVAVKLKWLLNLEEEASDVVTVVQYELKSRGRR